MAGIHRSDISQVLVVGARWLPQSRKLPTITKLARYVLISSCVGTARSFPDLVVLEFGFQSSRRATYNLRII